MSTAYPAVDKNIVSNLRSTAAFLEQFDEAAVALRAPWLDQAADEIERLRRDLTALEKHYPQMVADALARECVRATKAGDRDQAYAIACAQKIVADTFDGQVKL